MKSQNGFEELQVLKLQFILCCLMLPVLSEYIDLGDGEPSSVRINITVTLLGKKVENTASETQHNLIQEASLSYNKVRHAAYIIAEQNSRLVSSCLNRSFPDIYKYSDLLHDAGFDGLVAATINHNPAYGSSFSTYANSYIYYTMLSKIRQIHLSKRFRIINSATNWSKSETAIEAANQMSHSLLYPLSLDRRYSGRNPNVSNMLSGRVSKHLLADFRKEALKNHIEDKSINWREPASEKFLKSAINTALNSLSEVLAKTIKLRFGLCGEKPHTILECAELLGVSTTRIGQRINKALELLREVPELIELMQ